MLHMYMCVYILFIINYFPSYTIIINNTIIRNYTIILINEFEETNIKIILINLSYILIFFYFSIIQN